MKTVRLCIEWERDRIEGDPYVNYMRQVERIKLEMPAAPKRVTLQVLDEHRFVIGTPASYPIVDDTDE